MGFNCYTGWTTTQLYSIQFEHLKLNMKWHYADPIDFKVITNYDKPWTQKSCCDGLYHCVGIPLAAVMQSVKRKKQGSIRNLLTSAMLVLHGTSLPCAHAWGVNGNWFCYIIVVIVHTKIARSQENIYRYSGAHIARSQINFTRWQGQPYRYMRGMRSMSSSWMGIPLAVVIL